MCANDKLKSFHTPCFDYSLVDRFYKQLGSSATGDGIPEIYYFGEFQLFPERRWGSLHICKPCQRWIVGIYYIPTGIFYIPTIHLWHGLSTEQHLESVFVRPLWKIQCLGYGATWAQLRRSLWHMRQKVHVKGASFSSLLNRDTIRKWGKSWEGRSRQWCGIDYGVCCYSQLGSLIPSVYHVTFCALLVINILFCWNF